MQNNPHKKRPNMEHEAPIFEDDMVSEAPPKEQPSAPTKRQVDAFTPPQEATPIPNAKEIAQSMSAEGDVFKHVERNAQSSPDSGVTETVEPIAASPTRTPVTVKKTTCPKLSKKFSYNTFKPLLERKVDALLSAVEIPKQLPPQSSTAPLVSSDSNAQYYLINKSTGEVVTINKTLKIGNDASFADYIPMRNKTVSQKHAIFTVDSGILHVKDIGSSNGTYINGARIPVGFNIQLEPGQVVALSNEAFIVQKD